MGDEDKKKFNNGEIIIKWKGGQHSPVDSILASGPSYPGFESLLWSCFLEKISDVAVLTDSVLLIQWTVKSLMKLDRAHLVLATSKLLVQKNTTCALLSN